jgi:hypothetical protein
MASAMVLVRRSTHKATAGPFDPSSDLAVLRTNPPLGAMTAACRPAVVRVAPTSPPNEEPSATGAMLSNHVKGPEVYRQCSLPSDLTADSITIGEQHILASEWRARLRR